MSRTSKPVVLSIAGSDNSAGAGIQADLKTITAADAYALTAVTCVVAEVPGRVESIQPIRPAVVSDQIRLAFDAFPVAAVKTGMLYNRGIIRAVVDTLLSAIESREPRPALVVDPVMIASSEDSLLRPDAIEAYRKFLLPMATLVTPNLNELELLAGEKQIRTATAVIAAGRRLVEQFQTAFLLKGGHLGGSDARDFLLAPGGLEAEFSLPFVKGADPHGTGCTYSAAIAARLAHGDSLRDAVAAAKTFVTAAITTRLQFPQTEVLNHGS